MRWPVLIVAVLALPARADNRGAFCEVLPCLKGPIARRVLAKAEVHGKVTCKKGSELGVDSQQRLAFCTIAKPVDVDGLPVKAGSYTLFHPNGRIYQTHLRAKYEATLADKTRLTCGADLIAVLDDGSLKYCTLAAPRAHSPKPRVGEGIAFHANGKLAGLTLDETLRAAGLEIPAGTSVHYDDTGALIGGWLKDPIAAGPLSIRSDFALHANGKLRAVTLNTKATIQGHDFPSFAKLEFRADGTLERAEYVERRGTMPHGELWEETRHMTFDAAGKVASSHTTRFQSDVPKRKFR